MSTLTIATWDQLGPVTEYLNVNGIRLPVVNADSEALSKAWGVSGIPALVMLDRTGAVAAVRSGTVEWI